MENEDPVKGLIGEMNKRLRFDPTRFSLDEFDHLDLVDELTKLRILETPISNNNLTNGNINGDENKPILKADNSFILTEEPEGMVDVKQLKEQNVKDSKNIKDLEIEVTEPHKKPTKGILKPSLPPSSYARRSSLVFKQQSTRLLNRFLSFSKNSYYEEEEGKTSELNPNKLKRVRFSVPLRSTSYIIPSSIKLMPSEDNRYEQYMGLEGPWLKGKGEGAKFSCKDILEWYLSICNSREEHPNGRFLQILEEAIGTNQCIESIILTGESFPLKSILPISDVLDLFSNLTRLELEDCSLDDESIKVLVSNLLTKDRICMLSLANNPKIKSDGVKYIATYISQSKKLKSLDLSGIPITYRSAKFLARGIIHLDSSNNSTNESQIPLSPLTSPLSPRFNGEQDTNMSSFEDLKLNECSIRLQELKILCQGIIKSNIRSLALCGNNITSQGAQYISMLLSGSEDPDKMFLSSKLSILDLSQNSLKTEGLYCILSPLSSPNSQLEELKIGSNLIDEFGMVRLFEALKTNRKLHSLDLSGNPMCGPSIDGLWSIKSCFGQNNSLKSLFLSNTCMTSEGNDKL
ncbi:RNI-like protein [Neoconidiobolus thromboides FSU 785]|nr:RNI-like protein [Neoconidiobolus thromboides FSU 785]